MYACPRCDHRLERVQRREGVFWRCGRCRGQALAISLLRRTQARGYVDRIWMQARTERNVRGRPCPACARSMVEVPVGHDEADHRLDVCTRCQFVWFDPGEIEDAPASPRYALAPTDVAAARESEIPAAQRRLMADAQGAQPWEILAGMLGLPVEDVQTRIQIRPVLTWSLVGVVSLISTLAFAHRELVASFAFVPAEAFRLGGLTFLTPFFLHGGLWHLIGNMYFLLIFGDNVEDFLGRWRYALLLLFATVAGNFAHLLGSGGSATPCVGASGGISAVIAFYALQFPEARIGTYLRLGRYGPRRRTQMPAWMAFLLWLALQFLLTAMQLYGLTRVSALAHLGGAAVGVALWAVLKASRMRRTSAPFGPRP